MNSPKMNTGKKPMQTLGSKFQFEFLSRKAKRELGSRGRLSAFYRLRFHSKLVVILSQLMALHRVVHSVGLETKISA